MNLQFKKENDQVMLITGDVNQLLSFVDKYQDNLWPESVNGGWRNHEKTFTNHQDMKELVMRAGEARISIDCNLTRKAFVDCF
jgi:hypothetical protein